MFALIQAVSHSLNLVRPLLVTSALIVIAPFAQAETWHGGTLKFVYPQSDGSFVIGFNIDAPACTNGSSPKYMYVRTGLAGVTSDGVKVMYAAVLLALATDKNVVVAFNEASSACEINRLSVQ